MSIFRRRDEDWQWGLVRTEAEIPIERQVHKFMVAYQAEHHMPPTLDEISEILPSQYRSSAKHYLEKLISAGWAEEIAEEGKSRRVRALSSQQTHQADDELSTIFVGRAEL